MGLYLRNTRGLQIKPSNVTSTNAIGMSLKEPLKDLLLKFLPLGITIHLCHLLSSVQGQGSSHWKIIHKNMLELG